MIFSIVTTHPNCHSDLARRGGRCEKSLRVAQPLLAMQLRFCCLFSVRLASRCVNHQVVRRHPAMAVVISHCIERCRSGCEALASIRIRSVVFGTVFFGAMADFVIWFAVAAVVSITCRTAPDSAHPADFHLKNGPTCYVSPEFGWFLKNGLWLFLGLLFSAILIARFQARLKQRPS